MTVGVAKKKNNKKYRSESEVKMRILAGYMDGGGGFMRGVMRGS